MTGVRVEREGGRAQRGKSGGGRERDGIGKVKRWKEERERGRRGRDGRSEEMDMRGGEREAIGEAKRWLCSASIGQRSDRCEGQGCGGEDKREGRGVES